MDGRQQTPLPVDYLQYWLQATQQIQALQAAQFQQTAWANPLFQQSHHTPISLQTTAGTAIPVQDHAPLTASPAPAQAPTKGKRGRSKQELKEKTKAKKAKESVEETTCEASREGLQEKTDAAPKKPKRKVDRFNGMTEDEVMTKTLPDILAYNLDFVIIGINPGLVAAYLGRWFPGPGNHFWKCLFMSGISKEQLNHMHDQTLPEKYGIGFTNMVQRATPGSKDLSSKEFREGGRILVEKLQKYKPLIAVFNGKCIYEMFCREVFGAKPKNLEFGLQPTKIPETDTVCYLMPSSSARCAQFPRAQDKVHYYIKLKELRDQLRGVVHNQDLEEIQYTFDLGMAKEDAKKMAIKQEQYDPGYEAAFGGAYGEVEPGASQSASQCSFSCGKEQGLPRSDVAQVPDGHWMMESFTDQIPDIRGGSDI
ncbi:G/T mismatch-specific thymine DNA glycosylase-like [Brienomyrus brachyistius]|uniref:G/T mismatch-specific thymine DNA glycosylase-like n=1 Tax=Brienomyrus brachyistius TaxID=42636 RepID=UPI0020B3DDDA|nr:G/T mismatch-specific thymine DNA glycosylase-like [Brienomyrus brachyistius]XP_048885462.1 G/T mismatch-specific thymine DNA glycosylase-like [Brienomyrus brachyistius]